MLFFLPQDYRPKTFWLVDITKVAEYCRLLKAAGQTTTGQEES